MEKITLINDEIWDKSKLLEQMKNDDFYYGYLGKHALSSSSLKKIHKDFESYIASLYDMEEKPNSQALRDGRLIHLAALEPERLSELTIIDSTKGSKIYKEATEQLGEALVYTQRELDRCKELADAVRKDFEAFDLLYGCKYEVPEIKMVQGIAVRAKADAIRTMSDGKLTGIDLKTTRDASQFEDAINWFGYDMQAYLYMKIFNLVDFKFIVLDKSTKEVFIRRIKPEELAAGKTKVNNAFIKFKEWNSTKKK